MTSDPLMNARPPTKYAALPSFLAFSISGHSLFLCSLSSLERSSANFSPLSRRKRDVFAALHTASLQTLDENCRIIPLGLGSFCRRDGVLCQLCQRASPSAPAGHLGRTR